MRSVKITLPLGMLLVPAVALTIAVRVTKPPEVDGFGFDVSVVLVAVLAAGFTVCVSTLEVLVVKPLSPRYTAVIAWVPAVRLELLKLAVPATRFCEPNKVLASRKLTVPVGTPVPDTGLTCA